MKLIQRNYQRTEHDDFVLNVQTKLSKTTWAVPVYSPDGVILGWKIIGAYQ